MNTIADISTEDLIMDLSETIEDFQRCFSALNQGLKDYGGKFSVMDRVAGNARIGLIILRELDKRKVSYADTYSEIDNLRMQWESINGEKRQIL